MNQELKDKLKPFFVEVNELALNMNGIPFGELIKEEIMKVVICNRTECFHSQDRRVGGANLMKWFGNLLAAHLYLLSFENKWLTYEDLTLLENGEKASIHLFHPNLAEISHSIDRDEFVREHFAELFSSFQPLFQQIANESGLSQQQTWSLVTNPFYKHAESWLHTGKKATVEKDLQTIKSLDPICFHLKRNPFDVSFRYVDSWWEPVEPVRVKAACCMSYLKAKGNYCYSCPKLSTEDRLKKGEQLKLNTYKTCQN